jgi:hypothetical protein
MAIAKHDEIPQIKLNGKDIPIKDMSCRRIEIIKEVGNADVVKLELIGQIETIEKMNNSEFAEITVIDYMMKKKTKFRAVNLVEEDMEE